MPMLHGSTHHGIAPFRAEVAHHRGRQSWTLVGVAQALPMFGVNLGLVEMRLQGVPLALPFSIFLW